MVNAIRNDKRIIEPSQKEEIKEEFELKRNNRIAVPSRAAVISNRAQRVQWKSCYRTLIDAVDMFPYVESVFYNAG